MKIKLTSIIVNDQERALRFYTEILGFVKKREIPVGEIKWLTVVSPENDEIELLLEPGLNPSAKTYQREIYMQGIPATAFCVDDIYKEYERLKKLGVNFITEPTDIGPAIIAVFDDTCGNLIEIYQEKNN